MEAAAEAAKAGHPAPKLAVSSWSLHRAIGLRWPNRPDADIEPDAEPAWGRGRMTLEEFPAAVAALGIDRVEICSFHVRSRNPAALGGLRAALEKSGVTLQSLLVEYGDITDPSAAERDLAWIERWIDVAAILGAEKARIIAGKARPTPEALARSAAGLNRLARHAEKRGVTIVTENWFDLLATPADVEALFGQLDPAIGLNGDFGNWSGPNKYADLRAIFPRAVCCHAKADFSSGALDTADYGACLDAAHAAGFRGPYTLIYDGPDDDELAHLAEERDFIRAHLAGLPA